MQIAHAHRVSVSVSFRLRIDHVQAKRVVPDRAIDPAVAGTPEWRRLTMSLPASARAPVVVAVDRGNGRQPSKREDLLFDRATGEIVGRAGYPTFSRGFKIRRWLRFAHTGEVYGVVGQSTAGAVPVGAAVLVWTGLAGPILEALGSGDVLLVDELDTSLHPHLVAKVIDLFQDPRKNPKCAQLVFNAHDATILEDSGERRGLGRRRGRARSGRGRQTWPEGRAEVLHGSGGRRSRRRSG